MAPHAETVCFDTTARLLLQRGVTSLSAPIHGELQLLASNGSGGHLFRRLGAHRRVLGRCDLVSHVGGCNKT